jgi:hypothetical protein
MTIGCTHMLSVNTVRLLRAASQPIASLLREQTRKQNYFLPCETRTTHVPPNSTVVDWSPDFSTTFPPSVSGSPFDTNPYTNPTPHMWWNIEHNCGGRSKEEIGTDFRWGHSVLFIGKEGGIAALTSQNLARYLWPQKCCSLPFVHFDFWLAHALYVYCHSLQTDRHVELHNKWSAEIFIWSWGWRNVGIAEDQECRIVTPVCYGKDCIICMILHGGAITNSLLHRISWESDSRSVRQDIPRLAWNPHIHDRVEKSPPNLGPWGMELLARGTVSPNSKLETSGP